MWNHTQRKVTLSNSETTTQLGWVDNIEKLTLQNTNFRTVIHTGQHSQLTVMSIPPGSEIGWESHGHLDQFLRLEQGTGRLDLGSTEALVDERYDIEEEWAVIVPAGTFHNVVNTGDIDLKIYSVYSPPEHSDGTVHRTKAEADAAEHDH